VVDHSARKAATAEILREWEVTALPTMIFLDQAGQPVARLLGCRPPAEIIRAAEKAGG
jgi:thioredoxin-related protein